MEAKKEPGTDVTRQSSLYLSIGFVCSLTLTIAAFEWSVQEDAVLDLRGSNPYAETEVVEIPVTQIVPPVPLQRPVVFVEAKPQDIEIPDFTPIDQGEEPAVTIVAPVEPEPEPETDVPFIFVQESASPVGGFSAFYAHVANQLKGKYPAMARRMGIEGRVFVEFIIERNGALTDVHVVKGIGGGCDELAVRVLQSLPAWNPGKQRGKPVRQRMTLPIYFKLG